MESKGIDMSTVKRIWVCVAMIVTLGFLTAGCNTLEGFGEDLEGSGESIQELAD